jgi:hypothetical protein
MALARKTFQKLQVPAPSSDLHPATKKYVDDQIAGVGVGVGGGGSGAFTLVASGELTADASYFDVDTSSVSQHKLLFLKIWANHPAVETVGTLYLYLNGDETDANYNHQQQQLVYSGGFYNANVASGDIGYNFADGYDSRPTKNVSFLDIRIIKSPTNWRSYICEMFQGSVGYTPTYTAKIDAAITDLNSIRVRGATDDIGAGTVWELYTLEPVASAANDGTLKCVQTGSDPAVDAQTFDITDLESTNVEEFIVHMQVTTSTIGGSGSVIPTLWLNGDTDHTKYLMAGSEADNAAIAYIIPGSTTLKTKMTNAVAGGNTAHKFDVKLHLRRCGAKWLCGFEVNLLTGSEQPVVSRGTITYDSSAALTEIQLAGAFTDADDYAEIKWAVYALGNFVAPANNSLILNQLLVEQLPWLHEEPGDTTYSLIKNAPYPIDVESVTWKLGSGTCTMAVKIDSVDITGMSAISVTSTETETSSSGAKRIPAGGNLDIVLSSGSSPIDLYLNFKLKKVLT